MNGRRTGTDRRRRSRGGRRVDDYEGRSLVLLVDDHADGREFIAAVLAAAGIAVAEVATGREALQRLRTPPRPSAILLDLALPDCHGTDLLRTIRLDPDTAGIPVIVLSASVTPSDRQAAAQAGSAGFVMKPVLPEHLLAVVLEILAAS